MHIPLPSRGLRTSKLSVHDARSRLDVRIVTFCYASFPLEPKASILLISAPRASMSSSIISMTFNSSQCIFWTSLALKNAPARLNVSNVRLPNARERNGLLHFMLAVKCLRRGSAGGRPLCVLVFRFGSRAWSVIRSMVGLEPRNLNRKGRYIVPEVRRRSRCTSDGKPISALRAWRRCTSSITRWAMVLRVAE